MKSLWVLLIMAVGFMGPSPALAQSGLDEDPDWTDAAPRAPDRAKLRLYSGGRDEQDLEVQPALPTPSRYPDGRDLRGEAAAHD